MSRDIFICQDNSEIKAYKRHDCCSNKVAPALYKRG